MTRAPVPRGDSVVISSVADASPIAYPLAEVPNNYSYERVSDQPEAQPNQPLSWPLSFHGGIAYSDYDPRQAGAVVNSGLLCHHPNVIGWAPRGVGVTLTGAANPPMYFFETVVDDSGADDGKPVLYAIAIESAEMNVYKISLDSANFGTLLVTKTWSATSTQPMGRPARHHDGSNSYWYIPRGDNSTIARLTTIASGTAADTYNNSNSDARMLQIVGTDLWRSTDENQVSLLPRGSGPLTEANWGDDQYVGDASSTITELGEAGGLGYIGKEDGFYEWDTVGKAQNVLPEIGRATRNCQGMVFWHGGFKIPAASGLWWTRTGKPVGPDNNPSNWGNQPELGDTDYPKHGRWLSLYPYGEYIYGLYLNSTGSAALIMWGRERDETDPPGWGPTIWHVIDLVGADRDDFHGCFVAETSEFGASDVRPTLWVSTGNNVIYYWLDRDGAPLSRRGDIGVAGSATTVQSGNFHYGMPQVTKQLRVIQGWGENLAATHPFRFYVYRDGSASKEQVGSDLITDGFFQRFWTQDSNDTARSMIVEVNLNDSGTVNQNGPRVRNVTVEAVALPDTTPVWTFLISVKDKSKTAKKVRSELEGYIGDLKKYKLPDGDTFSGIMTDVRLLRADEMRSLTERMQEPPRFIYQASVREMVSS